MRVEILAEAFPWREGVYCCLAGEGKIQRKEIQDLVESKKVRRHFIVERDNYVGKKQRSINALR